LPVVCTVRSIQTPSMTEYFITTSSFSRWACSVELFSQQCLYFCRNLTEARFELFISQFMRVRVRVFVIITFIYMETSQVAFLSCFLSIFHFTSRFHITCCFSHSQELVMKLTYDYSMLLLCWQQQTSLCPLI